MTDMRGHHGNHRRGPRPASWKKPPGRPRMVFPREVRCEYCKSVFSRAPYGEDKMRFCGTLCVTLARPCKGRPRKLPSPAEVRTMYVDRNLPTTAIARMFGLSDPSAVRKALLRTGVTLRQRTIPMICSVDGCGAPVLKVRHAKLNVEYGRLCSTHRQVKYRLLNRAIHRKTKNINPARYNPWRYKEKENERKWLRENRMLLRAARRLSSHTGNPRDASVSPRRELLLVTTSLE